MSRKVENQAGSVEKVDDLFPLGNLNRRRFLIQLGIGAGLFVIGCRRNVKRAAAVYDVGAVKELLYSSQFIQESALLVTHDDRGWAAMSTRCTYDGCDMSYQQDELLCMCCGSVYSHVGEVLQGPAKVSLPYFHLNFADDHLYADTEEVVSPMDRYTTPELELALKNLQERLRVDGGRPGAVIPDALVGRGGIPTKGMFLEHHDVVVPSISDELATPAPSGTPSLFQRLLKQKTGGDAALPTPSATPSEVPGILR